MIGPYAYEATISTFLSALCKNSQERNRLAGLQAKLTIADEEDQLKKINEAVNLENFDRKQYPGKRLQKSFNYHKCFGRVRRIRLKEGICDRYEKIMKEENLLDFEDLPA